jgi:hypothetical protein
MTPRTHAHTHTHTQTLILAFPLFYIGPFLSHIILKFLFGSRILNEIICFLILWSDSDTFNPLPANVKNMVSS